MAQVVPGAGQGSAHPSAGLCGVGQAACRDTMLGGSEEGRAANVLGTRRDKVCAAVAGGMAGGVGVLVGQPFDMLKVRKNSLRVLLCCCCDCAPYPPWYVGAELKLGRDYESFFCERLATCLERGSGGEGPKQPREHQERHTDKNEMKRNKNAANIYPMLPVLS